MLLDVSWFAGWLPVALVINSVGLIIVVASGVLFYMIGCYVCGLVWLLFCLLVLLCCCYCWCLLVYTFN